MLSLAFNAACRKRIQRITWCQRAADHPIAVLPVHVKCHEKENCDREDQCQRKIGEQSFRQFNRRATRWKTVTGNISARAKSPCGLRLQLLRIHHFCTPLDTENAPASAWRATHPRSRTVQLRGAQRGWEVSDARPSAPPIATGWRDERPSCPRVA